MKSLKYYSQQAVDSGQWAWSIGNGQWVMSRILKEKRECPAFMQLRIINHLWEMLTNARSVEKSGTEQDREVYSQTVPSPKTLRASQVKGILSKDLLYVLERPLNIVS